MSVLHLVCRPESLGPCLGQIADGDAVLLLGDGVFAARDARFDTVAVPVAALGEDAAARGVALAPPVEAADYDTFVALVVAHASSITWT